MKFSKTIMGFAAGVALAFVLFASTASKTTQTTSTQTECMGCYYKSELYTQGALTCMPDDGYTYQCKEFEGVFRWEMSSVGCN